MPRPLHPAVLKNLLPAQVEIALSMSPLSTGYRLPAAEAAAMTKMAPKRRREFIHGRDCARTTLAALGLPDQAIPVGANREPVWPDGIIGSISHCGPVAMAAAARSDAVNALGIDLEIDEALDSTALNLICVPAEQSWSQTTDHPLRYAKLMFSAKESIYKCIWPIVRRFVDFQDVRIRVDIDTGTFAPVEWATDLPDAVMRRITGRHLRQDGWIMTAAWIPADPKRLTN